MKFDRRGFLSAAAGSVVALALEGVSKAVADIGQPTLRESAIARGFEVGAMIQTGQYQDDRFLNLVKTHFTLAANAFDEIAWGSNPGFDSEPKFVGLDLFLDFCKSTNARPRARQIYSRENMPRNAHLRADGTPQNKSELEKTLIKRVDQVCGRLKGTNAIIQVIDEILADHEGGLRKDPFTDAFGDELMDILFHAAHERMLDALLIYQEFGPLSDPHHFFKRKTGDYLQLLETLRRRNVPITGIGIAEWLKPARGGFVLESEFYKRIEDMGYDIHFDELTVTYKMRSDSAQWTPDPKTHDKIVAYYYEKTVAFFCQFKRLKEISFWAPVDGYNTVQTGTLDLLPYAGARPGLFGEDFVPKLAYAAVRDAIKKSKAHI
jgi:GH35 family endo-1,4-beta-xylanase